MNDVLLFLQKMEDEPIKENIIPRLPHVQLQVITLLDDVKNCASWEEANMYFDLLLKIQEVLACLVYKYGVEVSPELMTFVEDCDRLDDPWLREYLFNEIKGGRYSLKKGIRGRLQSYRETK